MTHAMAHIRPAAPAVRPLREELEFYGRYGWCLDPHLAASSVAERLRQEVELLPRLPPGWQAEEVACNVALLSCALLHVLEEAMRGPALKVPRRLSSRPWARRAGRLFELAMAGGARSRVAPLAEWAGRLRSALHVFLCAQSCRREQERGLAAMASALQARLPEDVRGKRIGVPSPYRRLDLTPQDSIALGKRLMARHPDRKQPVLLIGLRTSGSYFAPLLHALLDSEGYASVSAVTIQPEKGPGRLERRTLQASARNGALAVILDDSPHSGDTVLRALDFALDAGFPRQRLCALLPVHPTGSEDRLAALRGTVVVPLPAAEWRKQELLDPHLVEARLQEYYAAAGFSRACVVASPRATEANAELARRFSGHRGSRLKRVFEVDLETGLGGAERRLVLVKSVGVGWLGYHAFLLGQCLAGRVPPMLGLRDGMLYSEWVADAAGCADQAGERALRIESVAAYVAERARIAPLASASSGRTRLHRHENGLKLLARALSRAYGAPVTHALARPAVEAMLATVACPCPALIDGKMDEVEWRGPRRLQKADYEHHGMGKGEANVVDPAYDLASAAMQFRMSPEEQRELVGHYAQLSGDMGVPERLFLFKLAAGLWAMQSAGESLRGGSAGSGIGADAHARFMAGWTFLTFEAARFCGRRCTPRLPEWSSPLVFLDVDGVLDGRAFGFPCTTRAGIDALSLLHERQHSVVLNTARSALEVRTYCEAYALAGGVAEHGIYLWDAINGRERVLADSEAIRQLRVLRDCLNGMPGVFLDARHGLSLRAFTYRRTPTGLRASMLRPGRFSPGPVCPEPLPALMVEQCMRRFGLDRLAVHTTTMDTTVTINGHDKGTGLAAFRDWVAGPGAETVAVGDSAPDLPMFREASRSFAPSNIDCWREARLLGCRRAAHRHQRGLLEIAEAITGARRNAAERRAGKPAVTLPDGLFLALLETADRSRLSQSCGVLSWRGMLEAFRA